MRMDKVQLKWMILFAVCAIVIGGVVWWPAQRRISTLKGEIASAAHDLRLVQNRSDGLSALADQVGRLRQQMAARHKKIVTQEQLSELLRELSLEIEAAQMSGQGMSTGKSQLEEDWVVLPVEISCTGTSTDVFDLVNRIERMPWMLHIDQLEIERDKDDPAMVEAELHLTAYFQPEEGGSS